MCVCLEWSCDPCLEWSCDPCLEWSCDVCLEWSERRVVDLGVVVFLSAALSGFLWRPCLVRSEK